MKSRHSFQENDPMTSTLVFELNYLEKHHKMTHHYQPWLLSWQAACLETRRQWLSILCSPPRWPPAISYVQTAVTPQ